MTEPISGGSAVLDGFVHRFEPSVGDDLTLLALHGTGGDEHDLVPLARALRPRAAVLSPRGRVLERGMPRFFRRLAEGVFDQADLETRTLELAGFLSAASVRYRFDPGRVVAVGFSNGANIAASLLLRRPGQLRGAVLLRAMTPFTPERLVDLDGTPVVIVSGRHDELVPPGDPERLARLLQDAGADVTLHWDDGGHALEPEAVAFARTWLEERMPSREQEPERG